MDADSSDVHPTLEDLALEDPRMGRLSEAIQSNSYHQVVDLIKDGCYTDEELLFGYFFGCRAGYADCVAAILEKGVSPDSRDRNEHSALMLAAKNGQIAVIRMLIAWDCTVGLHGGPIMNTALHFAAMDGYLDCCEELFSSGAEVNSRNAHEETPLILASQSGHLAIVKFLLAHGASVRRSGYHDRTGLHCAAENGHFSCCKVLISNEADMEAEDAFGHTPLICAAEKGFVEVLRLLLSYHSDVNKNSHSAATALHLAAQHGDTECCELLLTSGAEIDAQDIRRYTPLMMASLNGHADTVSLLIDRKCNVNMIAYNRRTALHLAAERGKLTCCCLLLGALSNIDATDSNGCTPVHLAASRGHTDIVKFLLERGSDAYKRTNNGNSLLHSAAAGGNVLCCEDLITQGFHVDVQNNDAVTPLISAVSNKHINVVRFLLDAGCDVDIQGQHGMTALNESIIYHNGSIQMVETLLNHGADPDIADDARTLPLWFAVDCGNLKITKMLLQHVCTLDDRSTLSQTCGPCNPLEHAVHKQNVPLMRALVRTFCESGVNSLRRLTDNPNGLPQQWKPETKVVIRELSSAPCKLADCCRQSIRTTIGKSSQSVELVKLLKLPLSIRNYLLLDDLVVD